MKPFSIFAKLLSLIVLFFHANAVCAMSIQDDYSDLAIFGEQIKDKRIIYLDELTHGEHEVYALKTRLIKYLHQQHNFNVLLLESGLYDVQEIDKKSAQSETANLTTLAPGNIFYGYATDQGFTELLNYIDQQRQQEKSLQLSGFDGRLSGEHSVSQLVPMLKTIVDTYLLESQKPQNWQSFATLLQSSLDRKPASLTEQQKINHIKQTYQLISALESIDKQPNIDSPSYYAQLLKGVIRLFEVEHNYRRFDEHDLIMADNIRWLMEHVYPQQKVIIWGHYVHVNRKGYLDKNYDNLATRLNSYYPEQTYHVNIAGLSGAYRDYIDGQVKPLPLLTKRHLGYQLKQQFTPQQSIRFIYPKQFDEQQYQQLELHGFNYEANAAINVSNWQQHFDGVFLIKEVSPSQH
ncbi:erythromycin esterase family protein [Thalassotalea ganghwensis]